MPAEFPSLRQSLTTLAFDTTLETCSVAVVAGTDTRAHRSAQLGKGHAEALLPMIEAIMAEAKTGYDELDLVAVTTGPGTFTGQRIGLAAARGIGLARGIPVQGVSTLEALAWMASRNGLEAAETHVLVAMDARRGEIYGQSFEAPFSPDRQHGAAACLPIDEIDAIAPSGPTLIVGSGASWVLPVLNSTNGRFRARAELTDADAVDVALLATLRVAKHGFPEDPPAPLYLRAPDAKLPGGKSL